MNVDDFENTLFQFLNRENSEVAAIVGNWGVGKTYTWESVLKRAIKSKDVGLKKYSYVSLFGVNSIRDLKYAILANVRELDMLDKEISAHTSWEGCKWVFRNVAGKIKFDSYESILDSMVLLALSKTIVCIDDLERKGRDLEVRDVLGLVTYLKEKRNCKVVMLLNDTDEGVDEYEKYREKVIDISLSFDPTVQQCVNIAYKREGFVNKELSRCAILLNIKNIRVLKRIESLVANIEPTFEGFSENVQVQIIEAVVLFSWSHYCYGTNPDIPSLKYITEQYLIPVIPGSQNVKDAKIVRWSQILESYRFFTMDRLDEIVLEYVTSGYYLSEQVNIIAKDKYLDHQGSVAIAKFREIHSQVFDSFDQNIDHLLQELKAHFENKISYFEIQHLIDLVNFYRVVHKNDLATEVINIFVNNKTIEQLSRMEDGIRKMSNVDTEISSAVINSERSIESVTLHDAVMELIKDENNFHSYKYRPSIIFAQIEDWVNLFISLRGDSLHGAIGAVRMLGAKDGDGLTIKNKVDDALKIIASQSDLNNLRYQSHWKSL